ncbi:aminoglycoside phosphotransferase family protein [Neiella marina]|uniref:Aminoglycoside phosphotransferase family protein n=1 Tax=Neiella holothuriorum TaxID=2870530 RepID=A0ABS7EEJ5_9GAMM|nr:aminoglycoside phosphotransferase family protein [Neiella holothuriorum]MBW8190750.1 aminoglycoside phosphotransferase family protein [Neiella holothuriorum]
MILITSGAYISQDFASEVGVLPPSFLPVSNKRLFEHQLALLTPLGEDVYISVPDSYEILPADKQIIESNNVNLIRVPENIPLGESILYCWNASGVSYQSMSILHGDTLFSEVPPIPSDSISIHKNCGYYQRARVGANTLFAEQFEDVWATEEELVVSGFFSFQNPQRLMQGIVKSKGCFVGALEHYGQHEGLAPFTKGKWYDFGHLNSFFRSRTEMTTQRAFNEMTITPRIVDKASRNYEKMAAEVNWFELLPSQMTINTPKLVAKTIHSNKVTGYKLEYLYLLPLNDLFVFGELSVGAWKQIFSAATEVLRDFSTQNSNTTCLDNLNKLYLTKTLNRLEEFAVTSGYNTHRPLTLKGLDIPPISLHDMAKKSSRFINPPSESDVGIVHGDFCFSNILYDSRVQCIKMIDPRGIDLEGNLSIFGDRRYDFAKMYHSVVGLYDFIIAGRYEIKLTGLDDTFEFKVLASNRQEQLEKIFNDHVLRISGYSEIEILAINVQLFISMLPLHADRPERQMAMIANAIRLFGKLIHLTSPLR